MASAYCTWYSTAGGFVNLSTYRKFNTRLPRECCIGLLDMRWPLVFAIQTLFVFVARMTKANTCFLSSPVVFQDQHDGDRKLVTLSGNQLTITPSGSTDRFFKMLDIDSPLAVTHTYTHYQHAHVSKSPSYYIYCIFSRTLVSACAVVTHVLNKCRKHAF